MRYLLVVICVFSVSFSYAQTEGELFQVRGTDTFVAAIATEKFRYFVARQNQDNWCWAACTQMVLNYQGVSVSQNDIVEKAFHTIVNRPADCSIITDAADGWEVNGTVLKSFADGHIRAAEMIDVLAHKYPLIIGLNMPNQNVGHCYVLTAIYFHYDDDGNVFPFKVALRDPWPTNPSRVELTWNDFSHRINCIVHITY